MYKLYLDIRTLIYILLLYDHIIEWFYVKTNTEIKLHTRFVACFISIFDSNIMNFCTILI